MWLLLLLLSLSLDTPDLQRWRSCATRSGVRQGNEDFGKRLATRPE